MSQKDVAIVIPLSTRTGFLEAEMLSLRHLQHFLPDYETYFLAPQGMQVTDNRFPVVYFDNKYFGSVQAHSRLCLSRDLYDRFSDYNYILMHHLDCLVFQSDLTAWCEKGYDFIGPPWIKGPDKPKLKKEGVGNGGLSLRRVEAFQCLLNSEVKWKKVRFELKNMKMSKSSLRKSVRSIFKSIPKGISIRDHIEHYLTIKAASDTFLYKFGKIYKPDLNVAPVEEALKFGFEINPRICFERNNRNLPFGVHRWENYDKEFWKPYILKTP